MPQPVKTVGAIVLGVALGAGVVALVQMLGHAVFGVSPRLAAALEKGTALPRSEMANIMQAVPAEAKLSVVLSWALGMTAGPLATALVCRHQGREPLAARPGWAPATALSVLLAFTVMNFFVIPHPLWMMLAAVACALLGWIVIRRV